LFSLEEVEEPFIDAGLALVTALERGISADQIVTPVFEEVTTGEIVDEEISDRQILIAETPADTTSIAAVTAEVPTEATVDGVEETLVISVPAAETLPPPIATEQELKTAVSGWVGAWADQNLESYFASYHADFIPRYTGAENWEESRRRNITRPAWIRLGMDEFAVVSQEDNSAEVNFWLNYQSPNYSDQTQKKLLLRKVSGRWLILEEINLQVRR
jgi:hypothetical protein